MGGGADPYGALPLGALKWCPGNDVIDNLNDVFSDPTSTKYKDAQGKAANFLQVDNVPGNYQNLIAAYVAAFDAAGETFCSGWGTYLQTLGDLGENIVTTSSTATTSAVLTFGAGNIPAWMETGMNVYDFSTPGAITGGQTVSSFTTTTVTLTANVNAMVNAGDTIIFSPPGYSGNIVTTSSTATTSAVLTFDAAHFPNWMAKGLNVYDASTPGAITGGQTVSTFDNKTVTLTGPVNATVNAGDTIVFSVSPGLGQQNIYNIAQTRYQCLTANVGMTTGKHDPHDAKKSGHAVKLTGIIVTTSPTATTSAVLTFGAGNVPGWMATGLNVCDASTPGAITGGQTVSSFTTTTVTLTANVNATVNSGDTIVFSVPPGCGSVTIDSPYFDITDALRNLQGSGITIRLLQRYLQQNQNRKP
jgi:hypothetical protein